jgi:cell division protein FtsB
MKYLAIALLGLLVLLQYRLWVGDGGMREVGRLRGEIDQQRDENAALRDRNRTLTAEVVDLKKGQTAIEERARTDLGMVGRSETFYQVVAPEALTSPVAPHEEKPAPISPQTAPPPKDSAR